MIIALIHIKHKESLRKLHLKSLAKTLQVHCVQKTTCSRASDRDKTSNPPINKGKGFLPTGRVEHKLSVITPNVLADEIPT